MLIRRATAADAASIAALWNPYIRDTAVTFNPVEKVAEDVAQMIIDRDRLGHATFVAEDNGLLGFASYAQFRGGRAMRHAWSTPSSLPHMRGGAARGAA